MFKNFVFDCCFSSCATCRFYFQMQPLIKTQRNGWAAFQHLHSGSVLEPFWEYFSLYSIKKKTLCLLRFIWLLSESFYVRQHLNFNSKEEPLTEPRALQEAQHREATQKQTCVCACVSMCVNRVLQRGAGNMLMQIRWATFNMLLAFIRNEELQANNYSDGNENRTDITCLIFWNRARVPSDIWSMHHQLIYRNEWC